MSHPAIRLALHAALLVLLLLPAVPASAQRPPDAPEAATRGRPDIWQPPREPVRARKHMVVAANPLAAEAGREILRAGGSAVDAAIAVQLVLGLVEPQSSGLGGGAFLVHWDARSRAIQSYDGRETAPATATPDRFLRAGRPLSFLEAARSGLSVGVPGVLRMLELAHQRHGRLPWPRLFERAIALAERGFQVSPRLHGLLLAERPGEFSPSARAYFFGNDGRTWPIGHRLANPAYAATLRRIAAEGVTAFYEGPIARAIVAAVRGARLHPGDLAEADLAGYRARAREPVCARYRLHRVCSMGPPSSGGTAVAQILMLLDGFELGRSPAAALAPGSLHLIAEAEKLAFADRNWYLADPDFTPQTANLLDPGYIAGRRQLIDPATTLARPYPGLPPGVPRPAPGTDTTAEPPGTSHLSIVDGEGNAAAMTTTIEAAFGSGLWAEGFLLNNQLTDFSPRPRDRQGRLVANRIEGGKRPRSSMAPTVVLDAKGDLRLVTGSPGGARIIPYVVKSLVGVLDWQLDAQAAAALTNFGSLGGPLEIEAPFLSIADALQHRSVAGLTMAGRTLNIAIALVPLGQKPAYVEMTSGTHIIQRLPDGTLEGGADPRREGVALGD